MRQELPSLATLGRMIINLSWPRWKKYGIIYMRQLFHDGELLTFEALREAFNLPISMHFFYMQLRHAILTQSSTADWSTEDLIMVRLLGLNTG